jgi:5-methylcytosine-specific restriction endonuclease McrA
MYKTKICARCGKEYQPFTGNQKWCSDCVLTVRKEKGDIYNKGYRAEHKKENAVTCQRYDHVHLAEIKARRAAHHVAHREEENGRCATYGGKHREEKAKYRIDRKPVEAIRRAQYMKSHPEKQRLQTQKRRALKYGNTPVSELLTEVQWRDILNMYGDRCVYCGRKMKKLTMDHVIPLAKGGKHLKDNVVPCCRACNCKKNARSPEEWTGLHLDIGGNK